MKVSTFRAFRSRNYRLYFFGQSLSLIGTWMQRTAAYWVIYMKTRSALMLGVAVFATQFPSFLFSLHGGAAADRFDKYKVMLYSQIASMLQAIALTVIVMFTDYTVAEILILSVVLGVINAFDIPARQALVYYMVDSEEDLGNAIALNSSMVNLARLVSPALSGIALETLGAGVCFMINALSFIAVIASILSMRLPEFLPQRREKKVIEEIKEGINYIWSTPELFRVVLMMTLVSLLVMPYLAMFPEIAKKTLGGNAVTYGYLNSATGVGAICGTMLLASLKPGTNLRKALIVITFILGVGLALFSQAHVLAYSLIFATIAGFGMMTYTTLVNTILQTSSSEEMRGRVISYFAMAFFGMQPIGALILGSATHFFNASTALLSQGVIALILGVLFFPKLWGGE